MARKKECYPFWNLGDIKKMIDGFTNKKQWHWRLAFMIGLLLGRRVSDTLALKWGDLYYTDCSKRNYLEVVEQKTGKTSYVYIPKLMWKEIDLYTDQADIVVSSYLINQKIFYCRGKENEKGRTRIDASYRAAFKKVAKEAKIPYNVNTHSTRKTFGYYGIKLHPYDPANLDVLQRFFVHATREQTADYIGLTQEKQDMYSKDWASVMSDIVEGNPIAIENVPVVTLKSDELRTILITALKMEYNVESLDNILKLVEEKMVG